MQIQEKNTFFPCESTFFPVCKSLNENKTVSGVRTDCPNVWDSLEFVFGRSDTQKLAKLNRIPIRATAYPGIIAFQTPLSISYEHHWQWYISTASRLAVIKNCKNKPFILLHTAGFWAKKGKKWGKNPFFYQSYFLPIFDVPRDIYIRMN